jgi:hypothetical protein
LTWIRCFVVLSGLLLTDCAVRRLTLPAPAAALKIELFSVKPSSVIVGQSVVIRWRVKGAEKISIKPFGVIPSEGDRRIQIDADPGRLEFVLSATTAGPSKIRTVFLSVKPKAH